MMYERIAVTGAAGLIGSAVVRHLNKLNIEVLAFDTLDAPDLVPGSCTPIERVDLVDNRMIEILEARRPQTVVHAAAHPGGKSLQEPVENVRVNVLGSMKVFDWCARSGSHVIYLSSSVIYGDQAQGQISETASLMPGTIYGVATVACEQCLQILERGSVLSWTILRPFATYGSGYRPSLEQGIVNILLTQLLNGNQVVVKGSLMRRRDLVYVDDVANAIARVIFCPAAKGKKINIGSGYAVTIEEMISLLCDALKRPRSAIEIIEEAGTIGDPVSNVADITQMQKVLDFKTKYRPEIGLQILVDERLASMDQNSV